MTSTPIDAKALAFLAVALVVGIAVVSRLRRKTWSDHDVSDPGVTL